MRIKSIIYTGIFTLAGAFALIGCKETGSGTAAPSLEDSSGLSSSGTLKLNGEIISIPSPTQLAVFLQKSNVPFNMELVNPLTNRDKYASEQKKAMNLGLYGADLAYIANYERGQANIDYFEAVAKLAGDLQLIENLDKNLVSRLSNNISNKDSLLSLNAQFFMAGDEYLKRVQRQDIAGLILIGGWAEALHLALDASGTNAEVRSRVGEQKHAARKLANLVSKYEDPTLDAIKSEMAAVADLFDQLESTYKYEKPINDSKNKITYFRSKTTVNVSDDQVAELRKRVENLRNLIIQ